MRFNTLKEKCYYYRDLQETKLIPGLYTLVMLDGRSFSKFIKKKFNLPFDSDFINIMNETAKGLCEKVQGCKLAFVQSDEISLVLSDFDNPDAEPFFGYRLTKLLSIIPSIATGIFNKLNLQYDLSKISPEHMLEIIRAYEPVQFDSKAWQVPNKNEMFAWFLFRQNDCVRNSINQAAQSLFSHKQLVGLTSEKILDKMMEEKGVNWAKNYAEGEKYGRLIYKEIVKVESKESPGIFIDRPKWKIHDAWRLSSDEGKDKFLNLI